MTSVVVIILYYISVAVVVSLCSTFPPSFSLTLFCSLSGEIAVCPRSSTWKANLCSTRVWCVFVAMRSIVNLLLAPLLVSGDCPFHSWWYQVWFVVLADFRDLVCVCQCVCVCMCVCLVCYSSTVWNDSSNPCVLTSKLCCGCLVCWTFLWYKVNTSKSCVLHWPWRILTCSADRGWLLPGHLSITHFQFGCFHVMSSKVASHPFSFPSRQMLSKQFNET